MSASDLAFVGSVPEIYQRCLVPLLFAPYAEDMARRAAAGRCERVLETAAGTGVLTRALAPRLPPGARLTVTDLNPPMLERARSLQPPGPAIAWQEADAAALPFADASFDTVLCQFGMMFLPDRVRGMAEARRVLQPGGRFLFSVWDALDANLFAAEVDAAIAAQLPADPPRFFARTPHGYHDRARIEADVRAGGFAEVAIETVELVSRAATADDVAMAYCQGTPMRGEIEARAPGGLGRITEAVARAVAARWPERPLAAPMRAHVVTARG
ncbi:MAG: class I SAM-dependent methyltransferase [Geminicoccaceae bacterium]